jgi:hypothetical protein
VRDQCYEIFDGAVIFCDVRTHPIDGSSTTFKIIIDNPRLVNGGLLDESEKWFKLALQWQPDNTTILEGYAASLLQQGSRRESSKVISRIEKLDPDSPLLPQPRSQLQNLDSSR